MSSPLLKELKVPESWECPYFCSRGRGGKGRGVGGFSLQRSSPAIKIQQHASLGLVTERHEEKQNNM